MDPEDIKKDMMQAKIHKDTVKANLLSSLYSEIYTASKTGKTIGEEDYTKIIRKFIKNTNDTLLLDISDEQKKKLEQERSILESYLPSQLSIEQTDEEIKKLISEGKQMKDIMAYFKQNYPGRYDGRVVNERIRALTS
jgi:uncharacterized protein YqeY